ncbi:AcrR family transcriptional regulator [Microbacteriaceae bacterium SG_E_30_P1]|uniref:AcrR family transcriptional regulator n=1 Tax=Antiquaquibacter oligotrophicus TaxID=2880260 RepID=A0ABT6KJT0_9MICO|nr:TetR/AcrR family transcriptional regulator [Antiquaquibacter oligotrophicus]MDH6180262.1 AcrR family transcriptional regulator [Antiquaquibacter oligotrophicus]UDF13991.1 TetR/AcrR family transcriptional regulator [Antiquaquibacter oligotrophicus]
MNDEQARAQILDVADRLYYSRGIQAVGMDELRTGAGVSLKKLYQLFPSKAEIVEEVLRRRNREWSAGVRAEAEKHSTPRGKLLAIYDFLAGWFVQDDFRGCAFINSFGELGSTAPGVAEAARSHKASFESYVVSLAEEAGAGPDLAPQLVLLAEGAQTTASILRRPDVASHARAAAEVLIDAALATRATAAVAG